MRTQVRFGSSVVRGPIYEGLGSYEEPPERSKFAKNNIWKQMKHRMRLVRYALDLMLDALRHSIADKSILRVD
jgi:hypothetical protein